MEKCIHNFQYVSVFTNSLIPLNFASAQLNKPLCCLCYGHLSCCTYYATYEFLQTGNKKEAEKLVKNIIKMVIKLSVLYRNGQFSSDELKQAERFKGRFHSAAMAVVSFYEVDFSYDRHYLLSALNESRAAIRQLVQRHLTDKSLARIESLFNFFANPNFLDAVFKKDSEYREFLGRIVADMNRAMDEGGM